MQDTIPLLRAANALPLVRWMETNRIDSERYLKDADLGYWYSLSPYSPMPTFNGLELLNNLARDHGADVGFRIVDQGSIAELAFIGGVALGARTPLEALQRVSLALPMHSTHETISIIANESEVFIEHRFGFDLEPEAYHAVQVLFFSIIQQVCRLSGLRPPLVTRLEACPHPEFGLRVIEECFMTDVSIFKDGVTRIVLSGSVARNPFRNVARDRTRTTDMSKIPPLNDDGTFAGSVRAIIEIMLHDGNPSIARVARAANKPVRTLQRRLAEEQTSFSEQRDIVRRRVAFHYIGEENASFEEVSNRLGYSAQSSLTRAIRRLTGVTPKHLRQAASH